MRYWWVNQGQTYKYEVGEGFMWSPKRRKDGAYNQYYENMREVAPGDVVLSYANAAIRAWGRATSYCYDARRPAEFKTWAEDGWRVDVEFTPLARPLRTIDRLTELRHLLPEQYSPIHPESGEGQANLYLTELSEPLAKRLIEMVNEGGAQVHLDAPTPASTDDEASAVDDWDEDVQDQLDGDKTLDETERDAIGKARRGQGLFRERVLQVEPRCRITGTSNPSFLIASHMKPWRHCDNRERLDRYNGLMLAPHIDFLFDRGFISFTDEGDVLISPIADLAAVAALGLDPARLPNVGPFAPRQREYLACHRKYVFKKAGAK